LVNIILTEHGRISYHNQIRITQKPFHILYN
jgi:hypothetical protein